MTVAMADKLITSFRFTEENKKKKKKEKEKKKKKKKKKRGLNSVFTDFIYL